MNRKLFYVSILLIGIGIGIFVNRIFENKVQAETTLSNSELVYIKNQVASQINEDINTRIDTNLLSIYPVGSIYISTTNTDPSNFIGGTWSEFGSGRTLIGAGSHTDRNLVTKTFSVGEIDMGEYTHQITEEEMPEHTHELSIDSTSLIGDLTMNALANSKTTTYFTASGIVSESVAPVNTWYLSSSNYGLRNEVAVDGGIVRTATINATHNHTATNADTGGGTAHNNVQPYIVTYMWKRIS